MQCLPIKSRLRSHVKQDDNLNVDHPSILEVCSIEKSQGFFYPG